MATAAEAGGGLTGYLKSAVAPLMTRSLAVPVLLLAVILTFSNIVIARSIPAEGQPPPPAFILAAFVRVAGLLVLAVGMLRIVTASPRRRWLPDAGFWAYTATFVLAVALSAAFGIVAGDRTHLVAGLLINVAVTVLLAPLAAWFVALAVERPLAWRPGAWARRFSSWLPHFLFWSLLLLTPLAALHAAIGLVLVEGAGRWFWPLALFDGPLSVVLALLGLALAAEAHRRVARG